MDKLMKGMLKMVVAEVWVQKGLKTRLNSKNWKTVTVIGPDLDARSSTLS